MSSPEVPVRRVVMVGAGIIAAVVVAVAVSLGIAPGRDARSPLPFEAIASQPPLHSAPQLARERERRAAQQRLESAGWVDAKQGIVHIPITDAIAILAARAASAPEAAR